MPIIGRIPDTLYRSLESPGECRRDSKRRVNQKIISGRVPGRFAGPFRQQESYVRLGLAIWWPCGILGAV